MDNVKRPGIIYFISMLILVLGGIYSILPSLRGNVLMLTNTGYSISVLVCMIMVYINILKNKNNDQEDLRFRITKFYGVFLFSVIFVLDFGLLFMMLWWPEESYANITDIIVYGTIGIYFLGVTIYYFIKKPVVEEIGFRSQSAISATYFIYSFLIVLLSYLNIDFSTTHMFVILLIINASLTIGTLFMSLSPAVIGGYKTELSGGSQFIYFFNWIDKRKIFFFVGLFFTALIGYTCYQSANENDAMIAMGHILVGLAVLRLVIFIWNKKILNDDSSKINKSKNKLLMVSSIATLALSLSFVSALTFIYENSYETIEVLDWFIIVQVAFVVWRLIVDTIEVIKAKRSGDPYQLAISNSGIILMIVTFYTVAINIMALFKNEISMLLSMSLLSGILFYIIFTSIRLLLKAISGMKNS